MNVVRPKRSGSGLVVLLAVLAACGELSTSTALPDAGDADASIDAGGATDAAGATDAGELLVNGAFDGNCNPWNDYNATLVWVPDAGRSGGACKVCVRGTPTDGFGIVQRIGESPVIGQTYHAEAWVLFGAGKDALTANADIRTRLDDGGQVESNGHPYITLQSDYLPVTADLTLKSDAGAYVTLSIFAPKPVSAGDCFFIDDATMNVSGP
jgi:hypothetical protein